MEKFKLTSESGKEYWFTLADNRLTLRVDLVETEIKVGTWVISDNAMPKTPHYCTNFSAGGDIAILDNFGGSKMSEYWRGFMRPATPAEIEAHLRKVCEKYVGKRVRCLENGKIGIPFESQAYYFSDDEFWMNCSEIVGACVYKKGKFAEILPDKKKKPETKEDYIALLRDWINDDQGGFTFSDENISMFLDQYDI